MCRWYRQCGVHFRRIPHFIARYSNVKKSDMAENTVLGSRCLRAHKFDTWVGYLVFNLEDSLEPGGHMGLATSTRTEPPTTAGMESPNQTQVFRTWADQISSSNAAGTSISLRRLSSLTTLAPTIKSLHCLEDAQPRSVRSQTSC